MPDNKASYQHWWQDHDGNEEGPLRPDQWDAKQRETRIQGKMQQLRDRGRTEQGMPPEARPVTLFHTPYKAWEGYPGCVPASVSHVLEYWGRDESIEDIQKGMFTFTLPHGKGTFSLLARRYLRGLGFEVTTSRKTTADDVKKELDAGRPVLVHTNMANRPWANHMSVVHGYDDSGFYLANEAKPYMSYNEFNDIWSAPWSLGRQHEAIFVKPSDKVLQRESPWATKTTAEEEMPHGKWGELGQTSSPAKTSSWRGRAEMEMI